MSFISREIPGTSSDDQWWHNERWPEFVEMKMLRAHLAEMRHIAEDVSDLSQAAAFSGQTEHIWVRTRVLRQIQREQLCVWRPWTATKVRRILPSVCHHKAGVDRPQISPSYLYSSPKHHIRRSTWTAHNAHIVTAGSPRRASPRQIARPQRRLKERLSSWLPLLKWCEKPNLAKLFSYMWLRAQQRHVQLATVILLCGYKTNSLKIVNRSVLFSRKMWSIVRWRQLLKSGRQSLLSSCLFVSMFLWARRQRQTSTCAISQFDSI